MSEQVLETYEFWTVCPVVFRNQYEYYRDFQTIAEEKNTQVLRGNSFRNRLTNGSDLEFIQPVSLVNIAMKSIVIREYIGFYIKYLSKEKNMFLHFSFNKLFYYINNIISYVNILFLLNIFICFSFIHYTMWCFNTFI